MGYLATTTTITTITTITNDAKLCDHGIRSLVVVAVCPILRALIALNMVLPPQVYGFGILGQQSITRNCVISVFYSHNIVHHGSQCQTAQDACTASVIVCLLFFIFLALLVRQ